LNGVSGSVDSGGGAMIRVRIAEELPAGLEDGALEGLANQSLSPEVRRTPIGPYAATDAYVPTLVMVFVAAGYLNGFLRKVGEDHYEALKTALGRLEIIPINDRAGR
jgi:hypothetical protein